MTIYWRYWGLRLAAGTAMGGAKALLLAIAGLAYGDCASAQIVPDGTLPNNSIVTSQGNTSIIEGGTQKGSNLFHSFNVFSVPTGSAVYFNNATDIQNIISRVTGSSISNVDGLIRANGTANLFLLNPNGIIFGSNATLAIGGSFLGTTASAVNFADNTQFSATANSTTPLLQVSVPLGLQFGSNAGSIQVFSNGKFVNGQFVGLQVQPSKTLALVGGDVRLDGGNLQAPGSRVELGGVSGGGKVGLNVDNSALGLSFPNDIVRADVSLINEAEVNVTAGGGGSVAINARNLDILSGSSLAAGIKEGLGSFGAQAGNIEINAIEQVTIAGTGFTDSPSGIFNFVNRGAIGNAGEINIQAGSLSVTNGALLAAGTRGGGNAGSVSITATDTIYLDGVISDQSSGVFNTVGKYGVGKGGSINITAESLFVKNGAQLNVTSQGRGDAGSVTINADDTISFEGVGINGRESGVISVVAKNAVGKAGNIDITTESLLVKNGAGLSANSAGNGTAGNIEISASSISLENKAFLSSNTMAGQGNIILSSQDLVLHRGSNITTNAKGTATGGNITIDTDILAALENSDITANASKGQGGIVQINTQGLFLSQDSEITATGGSPELSGTVEINTPDVDPSQGLVELPVELVDTSQQIATSCAAVGENKFIIIGHGGLPPNPSEPLSSDAVWSDLRTQKKGGGAGEAGGAQGAEGAQGEVYTDNLSQHSPPASSPLIVEATGWVINNKGEVVLTASAPTATPHTPWIPPANCHTAQTLSSRKNRSVI